MYIFNSCADALQHCLDTRSFGIAHLYNTEKTMDIHIHDCYEIYYSISGGKQFLINNCLYDFAPGDIFFINSFESHHLLSIEEKEHERIVIHVHPDYIKDLCTKQTNLDYCFSFREIEHNNIRSLSDNEQKRFLYFMHELSTENEYGQDMLDHATFIRLMVFLNEIFMRDSEANAAKPSRYTKHHVQFNNILSYINQHLTQELTIQELSDHFFLCPSHLCSMFKKETGTTIKKYITAQRITLAKSLLTSGHSAQEACEMSGFIDYSNFFKTFTKIVGVSPRKYSQFSLK